MIARITIAGIALGLLGIPVADAAPVSAVRIQGDTLSFVAAERTLNRVVVEPHPNQPGAVRIVDTGSNIAPTTPCVAEGSTTAKCPLAGVQRIVLDLGDGDDSGSNLLCKPTLMYGRGEDDQLTGGCGNDVLVGGPGKDKLRGGWGDDQLFGEGGDDFLDGEQGLGDMADGGIDLDFCIAEVRANCP